MSSEAKVGLLVGLAFVFVISFLINGIPKIGPSVNNNELTANMIKPQTTEHALAAKERKAIKKVQSFRQRPAQLKKPQPTGRQIRFQMPLANNSSVIKQSPARPARAEPVQSSGKKPSGTITGKKNKIKSPEYYIVREGDNLSLIAQRFYGPDEGNKISNIEKIYHANSGILSDPDKIFVAQKLIIPPPDNNKIQRGSGNNLFSPRAYKQAKIPNNTKNKKHPGYHIVRDGDSLWKIAEQHLGSGRRYKEIAALNSELLNNENNLSVGMKLKLPPG